ncbi:enoyl-CoA hydratase/isomerase family protein [Amycolatopsis acidicola]|uniref:enoyl-CoA hydratase/isomerase family protein n=1 Tax=Amycolatopsis acidicola TaxID=2596893 RepID=UPI0014081068|nr:enoyl-CoA hydratase-related protein [Amycolatopsis acidicola]
MSGAVEVTREGSLGWIRLNQPERRNPLDRATAEAVTEAFRAHFADPRVRSVCVTGEGKAFCAGGDLAQMGRFSEMGTAAAFDWPGPIVELHRLVLRAEKPVIAAVNGPAYAGGMGLAGMCDVLLAVRDARFAMPEIKVGIFPMIIVAHLCRALPRKRLMEMMFTGDPMGAGEAHRLGFVNRLYGTADELADGAREFARKFDQVSPAAAKLGRRAFGLLADLPADQAIDAAQFLVMPFHLGEDIKEGAAAFLEGRSPNWVPRDPTGQE